MCLGDGCHANPSPQRHASPPLPACSYELHHGVKISDSALVEAAVLSDRYIADRFLPGGCSGFGRALLVVQVPSALQPGRSEQARLARPACPWI